MSVMEENSRLFLELTNTLTSAKTNTKKCPITKSNSTKGVKRLEMAQSLILLQFPVSL